MTEYSINFFTIALDEYQWDNRANDNFKNGMAAVLFYQMAGIHKDIMSIICD